MFFLGRFKVARHRIAIDYRIDDDLFDVVIFKFLVLQYTAFSITITTIQMTTNTTFVL